MTTETTAHEITATTVDTTQVTPYDIVEINGIKHINTILVEKICKNKNYTLINDTKSMEARIISNDSKNKNTLINIPIIFNEIKNQNEYFNTSYKYYYIEYNFYVNNILTFIN